MKAMKHFGFFVFMAISLFIPSILVAESAPQWLKKPEKVYPSTRFIRGEGEGKSAKSARNAAVNAISMFFDTKSEAITLAVEKSRLAIENDDSEFSSDRELVQATAVSSVAEFFCLKFTEVYFDEKHDEYHVLAYLDKNEAADVFRTRIAALLRSAESWRDYAASESEPFLRARSFFRTQALYNLASRYIKAETVIVPSDGAAYKSALEDAGKAETDYARAKKGVSFAIELSDETETFAPVRAAVSATLEKRGWAVQSKGALYLVYVNIVLAEENYESGLFVRPTLSVSVQNQKGASVYTYSKAFPRMSGKSREQIYTRAAGKIRQDLEENFLAE